MVSSKSDPEQGLQQPQPQYVQGEPVGYYGTFQGQPGYPYPVPPSQAPHYPQSDGSYAYPSVRGVRERISEGRPILGGEHFQRNDPLPFCGLGFGWFLFIFGFVCVVPWYIGTVIFFCLAHDNRERTGLLACAIAALVCLLAGGAKVGEMW